LDIHRIPVHRIHNDKLRVGIQGKGSLTLFTDIFHCSDNKQVWLEAGKSWMGIGALMDLVWIAASGPCFSWGSSKSYVFG